MSKGLPIALSIPTRFKKDRRIPGKGEKKPGQLYTLLKHFVLRFANFLIFKRYRDKKRGEPPLAAGGKEL